MRAVDILRKKRDGQPLDSAEIEAFVQAVTSRTWPEYQTAALLMAIVLRGMNTEETAHLTRAMVHSGQRLDLSDLPGIKVDKHSTGGVGDKLSLILAPLAAACGVMVPMMSGRGLGHTGGTLDKLESIPGFRTNLSLREARAQIDRLGCAMLGQTPEIAPADKRLYALRDVTATVESIPLISASIMSKKLAEGLNGLVLDVKTGSGAFLTDLAKSIELARTMISLGEARGCPTVALLTAMDRPLGRACGNALEMEEAIEGLRGSGPADLLEVTYALGAEMLLLVGAAPSLADARARLEQSVASGRALETFARVIEAQGGNPGVIEDLGLLPQAQAVEVYRAEATGVVAAVEPRRIGRAIVELGGGRTAVEDAVDPTVGFVITVKPGDPVRAGEPIASIFARDETGIAIGTVALREAVSIGDTGRLTPLISHRITSRGVERLAAGI
jgi:pyrimidine-nucleoside phosphorylase